MNKGEKKEEIKFNVPLFSVDEYAQLENNINFHLEEYTNEILKTFSKDKEVVILKKVIEKQQKEIEELKNNELDYTTIYMSGVYDGEKKHKDKIREKIKKLREEPCYAECAEAIFEEIEILEELLKE